MDVPIEIRERWRAAMADAYRDTIKRSECEMELEAYLATFHVLDDCGEVEVAACEDGPWTSIGPVADSDTVRALIEKGRAQGGVWLRCEAGAVQLGVWHRLWFAGETLGYEDEHRRFWVLQGTGEMVMRGKYAGSAVWFRADSRADERWLHVGHLRCRGPVKYADAVYMVPREFNGRENGGRSMPFVASGEPPGSEERRGLQKMLALEAARKAELETVECPRCGDDPQEVCSG